MATYSCIYISNRLEVLRPSKIVKPPFSFRSFTSLLEPPRSFSFRSWPSTACPGTSQRPRRRRSCPQQYPPACLSRRNSSECEHSEAHPTLLCCGGSQSGSKQNLKDRFAGGKGAKIVWVVLRQRVLQDPLQTKFRLLPFGWVPSTSRTSCPPKCPKIQLKDGRSSRLTAVHLVQVQLFCKKGAIFSC